MHVSAHNIFDDDDDAGSNFLFSYHCVHRAATGQYLCYTLTLGQYLAAFPKTMSVLESQLRGHDPTPGLREVTREVTREEFHFVRLRIQLVAWLSEQIWTRMKRIPSRKTCEQAGDLLASCSCRLFTTSGHRPLQPQAFHNHAAAGHCSHTHRANLNQPMPTYANLCQPMPTNANLGQPRPT